MKTSNKILLGFISVLGLCMFSLLIFAKSSLINVEDRTVEGDGKVIKKNYNIGEISFFRTGGSYEIYLKEGEPELIIEADENILAFLRPDDNNETYVKTKDGVSAVKRELRIGRNQDYYYKPSQKIKVYLTSPVLEKLSISGDCIVKNETELVSDNFEVRTNGSSDVDLRLKTGDLKIKTSGGSQVNISGEAGNTIIDASGSSSILLESINAETTSIEMDGGSNLSIKGQTTDLVARVNGSSYLSAADLLADEANIFMNGGSRMSIHVNNKMHVGAGGSSEVVYSGDPEISEELTEGAKLKKKE